tara:strand:- start:253 stop:993 length:741 start_codon:yes stop_codon:yes gene_type:complete
MKEKFNFLFKLLLAAIFVWVPLKVYKSVNKVEYLDHKYDVFIGDISPWTGGGIIQDLKKAKVKNRLTKEINIGINSGGGSVLVGLEILGEMKSLKADGYKITCYANNAFSMGFVLLAYCDERIGRSTSVFMHHLTQVNFGRPERNDRNKKLFKALDFFDNLLKKDMAKKFGLDEKKYFDIIKDDKWWDAKSALKSKILDRIEEFTFYEKKYRIVINFLNNKKELKDVRKKEELSKEFSKEIRAIKM